MPSIRFIVWVPSTWPECLYLYNHLPSILSCIPALSAIMQSAARFFDYTSIHPAAPKFSCHSQISCGGPTQFLTFAGRTIILCDEVIFWASPLWPLSLTAQPTDRQTDRQTRQPLYNCCQRKRMTRERMSHSCRRMHQLFRCRLNLRCSAMCLSRMDWTLETQRAKSWQQQGGALPDTQGLKLKQQNVLINAFKKPHAEALAIYIYIRTFTDKIHLNLLFFCGGFTTSGSWVSPAFPRKQRVWVAIKLWHLFSQHQMLFLSPFSSLMEDFFFLF